MLTKDINSRLIDAYGYPESEFVKEAVFNLARALARGEYTITKHTDYNQLICILCEELEKGVKDVEV